MKKTVKKSAKTTKPGAKKSTKKSVGINPDRVAANMICPEFASISIGPSGVRGKGKRDTRPRFVRASR